MKQLLFSGPICETGYGIVATNQLYELDKLGHELVLFAKNPNRVEAHKKYHDVIQRSAQNIMKMNPNSTFLNVWHQFELFQRVGRGKYIGYPIFEMDRMTPFEQLNLKQCDNIVVCSKWAQQVLAQHDIKSEVVPLGVDLDVFTPKAYKGERKNFIFGNFGKWEIRKGHDILISAFNKAFEPTDNVELWACCQNFLLPKEDNDEWNNLYMKSKMGKAGKIKLIPRQESQDQVANMMNHIDLGVFPARAEGWNLEVLELMALEIPSIVTDYAGHTEFCTPDNSFLLPITGMEEAYDGKWFKPGLNANQGEWAVPDEEMLVDLMRIYYKNQDILRSRIEWCPITAKKYSWSNCAKRLSDVVGI